MLGENEDEYFSRLYEATHKRVLSYIIAKCGNTEDVSDIFQETYMEVVRVIRRRGIGYIKNPEAFVMQIAKRKIFHHYKLDERLRTLIKKYNTESMDPLCAEREMVSFEERLMTKETVAMAADYLMKKDELTKKIFYLYYYMNKPIKEIAELLSVTESNVKNRLYRNLRELREYLIKNGMDQS